MLCAERRERMNRPNIVYIVADDLGFADLGCYGGRAPISPVLDRLAEAGLRFTQGYAKLSRVLADAIRPHDRSLPVPAARRGRGADQQQEPRQHDARPAARASDPAVAAQGRRLPHRARRQVASSAIRRRSDRCARAMTSSSGRCRAASTTSATATRAAPTTSGQGDAEHVEAGYLTDLISARAVDCIGRFASAGHAPFFLSVPLHRAALALGNAAPTKPLPPR